MKAEKSGRRRVARQGEGSRGWGRAEGDPELLRRVDWRFLLPRARLGRVGYLGDPDIPLARALRRYGTAFVDLRSERGRLGSQGEADVDLAVVKSPGSADLARAARSVRPGGALYCELGRGDGGPWPGGGERSGRNVSLAAARRILADLAYEGVRGSWHHPDFEGCRRIVPLEAPAVWGHLAARGRSPRLRGPARRLGSWAGRTPWTGLALSRFGCVSVVGTRKGGARS